MKQDDEDLDWLVFSFSSNKSRIDKIEKSPPVEKEHEIPEFKKPTDDLTLLAWLESCIKQDDTEYVKVEGNLLLISDRKLSASHRLGKYFAEKTNLNVLGIVSDVNALKKINDKIDYVIIVGYLTNKNIYHSLVELRCTNNVDLCTLFYAKDSNITKLHRRRWGIKFLIEPGVDISAVLYFMIKLHNRSDIDGGCGWLIDFTGTENPLHESYPPWLPPIVKKEEEK